MSDPVPIDERWAFSNDGPYVAYRCNECGKKYEFSRAAWDRYFEQTVVPRLDAHYAVHLTAAETGGASPA